MSNLRKIALAATSGFRTKEITVPEWEDVTVTIREPSAEAWLQWQDIIKPHEEGEQLTPAETAHRNMRADVVLFINILLEDGKPVFTLEDLEEVAAVYGPVHARIVKQALNLSLTPDEAEKK